MRQIIADNLPNEIKNYDFQFTSVDDGVCEFLFVDSKDRAVLVLATFTYSHFFKEVEVDTISAKWVKSKRSISQSKLDSMDFKGYLSFHDADYKKIGKCGKDLINILADLIYKYVKDDIESSREANFDYDGYNEYLASLRD